MKTEDYWKRGFRFWIRFPIYIITDFFGIMNHWDKYKIFDLSVGIANKFEELEKRIQILEKRGEKNGRKRTRKSKNNSSI